MKMIKKVKEYEVPKYQVMLADTYYLSFDEITGLSSDDKVEVYFNKNHSGLCDFDNFLNAEERWFEEESELEEIALQSEMPHWLVVSFYRENGFNGVYTRTGNMALTVKCNNWVNNGRDGFLFIFFGKTQEDIDHYIYAIEMYVNYGINMFEIYNNETEEFEDSYIPITDEQHKKMKELWKEIYGLKDEDFENLYY